jgi:sec-independent protein translocase protein TatB
MFDIGFSELVVIGVVALVVLGPERLPKVARTAGLLFGRLQRYVATVKADLNREMEMSELSRVKQEVQEAARAFEQGAQQHVQSIEAEARAAGASLNAQIAKAPGSQTTAPQPELLAEPQSGPADADLASSPPKASKPAERQSPPHSQVVRQGALDLGIEPVRGPRC